ncbi:MAG: hypothetical protein AAGK78_14100, partial [Planctomycetota bacterium]
KHLKDPLVPPDHINVALGPGISEVIEYAMGKDRRERYATAQQMLDDLRAVRAGESPGYARRQVDFDSLAQMEQAATQHTVDYQVPGMKLWEHPAFIVAAVVAAASLLINLILLFVMMGG